MFILYPCELDNYITIMWPFTLRIKKLPSNLRRPSQSYLRPVACFYSFARCEIWRIRFWRLAWTTDVSGQEFYVHTYDITSCTAQKFEQFFWQGCFVMPPQKCPSLFEVEPVYTSTVRECGLDWLCMYVCVCISSAVISGLREKRRVNR